MDAPVKFVTVKLSNRSGRTRRLSLAAYWELVLGEWRHTNLMHIVTEKDPETGALFARNAYSRRTPGRVVFAQVSEPKRSVTGSRMEFIGTQRLAVRPGRDASRASLGQDGRGHSIPAPPYRPRSS